MENNTSYLNLNRGRQKNKTTRPCQSLQILQSTSPNSSHSFYLSLYSPVYVYQCLYSLSGPISFSQSLSIFIQFISVYTVSQVPLNLPQSLIVAPYTVQYMSLSVSTISLVPQSRSQPLSLYSAVYIYMSLSVSTVSLEALVSLIVSLSLYSPVFVPVVETDRDIII